MPHASLPPYSLPPHRFHSRALANWVGHAPLGGAREVALACLMAARMVIATLPPYPLPAAARAARASAFRVWLASLALPAGLRAALTRVADATARDPMRDPGSALHALADAAASHLDAPSRAELARLADAASMASAREG
ncbi:MAG TPA: hypothetical protein VJ596_07235 [Gemmatimonadaceae bacterium]|nr:hypothetical protein [Gemmatimonadaceae bacterium]